jgi:hypothetical protein
MIQGIENKIYRFMPVILATWKMEIRSITVPGQQG